MQNHIQFFLQTNDSPEIKRSTLWETLNEIISPRKYALISLKKIDNEGKKNQK